MAHVIDSEVFLAFSTYATIVILKMMFMSPLTGYYRFTRKVTEDTLLRCIRLFESRVWSILTTLVHTEHNSIFITTLVKGRSLLVHVDTLI